MRTTQQTLALLVCCTLISVAARGENQVGYTVKYSGGSLPDVKGGEDLRVFIESSKIRLQQKKNAALVIPTAAITEISYGQEVHRRIGTAVGLAIISLGIGALTAFSKSKKHYIGITWADGENKGGVALQADKNEYRGLIAALEGVTGKKAVDTDTPTEAAAKSGLAQPVADPPASATRLAAPAQAEAPQVIPMKTTTTANSSSRSENGPTVNSVSPASVQAEPVRVIPAATVPVSGHSPVPLVNGLVDVTFASNPPGALVSFSGMAFSTTPFVTRLQPGSYPIKMTLSGYPDWVTEVTIDAGKPATVVAQLNSTTGVVLK